VCYLGEYGQVELSAWWNIEVLVAGEQWGRGRREGTFSVELSSQVVPILQTNFEDLCLLHLGNQQHVVKRLREGARQNEKIV